MENYSMYLPAYSIGNAVYEKAPAICRKAGKTAVLIGGKKALAAAGDAIEKAFRDSEVAILDRRWYGGEATWENVEALAADKAVQASEIILAVGGGKALDTCKALGEKLGKSVFTFPTIASTCAATTAVSIMFNPDGSFHGPFFLEAPPVHAFISTPIIAAAPRRYMWAGMGDTYAKYFESEMSSRGEDLVHYHALGVNISRMCLDPILKYGALAMEDNGKGEASFALEQVVLAIVVTTGIASILLTKEHIIDYNTGLAHAVYYALTRWKHIDEKHLHGEVVSFGILLLLLLDGQEEMFRKLLEFSRAVGLPTKLEDIEFSPAELKELIPAILSMHDIDHNPYPITAAMLEKAFADLEKQ